MYPDLDPKMEEFKRLFAQINIQHQKLIKSWPRDILICERVLGKLTPTPPGVGFWKINISFYPAGHKENEKEQGLRIPGDHLVV